MVDALSSVVDDDTHYRDKVVALVEVEDIDIDHNVVDYNKHCDIGMAAGSYIYYQEIYILRFFYSEEEIARQFKRKVSQIDEKYFPLNLYFRRKTRLW